MRTKKLTTDEGGGCVDRLELRKKSKDSKAVISVNIGNSPIELGLYKLYRLRDWVESVINEIEEGL